MGDDVGLSVGDIDGLSLVDCDGDDVGLFVGGIDGLSLGDSDDELCIINKMHFV